MSYRETKIKMRKRDSAICHTEGRKYMGQNSEGVNLGRWGQTEYAQLQDPHGENIHEGCGDIQYTKICKRCVMAFIITLLRMPVLTY